MGSVGNLTASRQFGPCALVERASDIFAQHPIVVRRDIFGTSTSVPLTAKGRGKAPVSVVSVVPKNHWWTPHDSTGPPRHAANPMLGNLVAIVQCHVARIDAECFEALKSSSGTISNSKKGTKYMKNAFLLATVLALTACGGGSGGSNVATGGQAPVETPVDTTVVLGGSASAPAALSLNSKNVVNNNSFNNYFKYEAVAGEQLIIRVSLNIPLSDIEFARCSGSGTDTTPSSYGSQIHVYNAKNVRIGGTCREDLTYTFSETGVYVFNFDYPSQNSGFFHATVLKGDNPVEFLEVGSGTPGKPRKLNTASANSIGSNVFFNYYWISAVKGETITINTTLNQPLSTQQKTRCAGTSESHNSMIYVYNSKLNKVGLSCGENIRFSVPETGNYIFQFNYGSQSSGVFNAAKN
jgi:hypothetical protein